MEQFVAQLLNRGGVNEGFVLHDVEDTIAHFDLNAHLEPLVVDVETGAQLASHIKAFGDQVVDEFFAIDAVFVVFL